MTQSYDASNIRVLEGLEAVRMRPGMYVGEPGTGAMYHDCIYILMKEIIDNAIDEIASRVTRIGAVQNRISSAMSALDVKSQNLTSSLSTLRDTDVAEESSNYIQSQILQQASATLLATANQSPQIALNLI